MIIVSHFLSLISDKKMKQGGAYLQQGSIFLPYKIIDSFSFVKMYPKYSWRF